MEALAALLPSVSATLLCSDCVVFVSGKSRSEGNRRPWCAGLDGDGRRDVQRSWRSSASVVLVAPGRVLTLLHLAEV